MRIQTSLYIRPPFFLLVKCYKFTKKKKSPKKGRQSREMLTTCVAQSYIQTHARNQPSAAAVPHSKNHRPILLYLVVQRNIYVSQQHPPIFQKEKKKGLVCQRKRWNHRFHSPPKVQAHLFFFFSSATPSSSVQRGSYDYYIREMSLFRWWSHSPVFIPFGHSLTISSTFG